MPRPPPSTPRFRPAPQGSLSLRPGGAARRPTVDAEALEKFGTLVSVVPEEGPAGPEARLVRRAVRRVERTRTVRAKQKGALPPVARAGPKKNGRNGCHATAPRRAVRACAARAKRKRAKCHRFVLAVGTAGLVVVGCSGGNKGRASSLSCAVPGPISRG
jgi:hypothetical protein